ncbi:MAG: thiopurine S-methyltransferase [Deltaproteobacteria bacterium]|nr:MAG: thiopurine S-methyltransferase [Deltaproteobacteria bacterium]
MKSEFWLERWELGQTGWHNDSVHPGLQEHCERFGTASRVLVPLCGASLDVRWLTELPCVDSVVGVELSAIAIERLFADAGLNPEREQHGAFVLWKAGPISIVQGDFFAAPPALVGPVDAVWDRAAMIAIDPERRDEYAAKLKELAPGGHLLLNALVYDQSVNDGPPWALSAEEVVERFGPAETLSSKDALDDRWRERGHAWVRTELHYLTL